MAAGAAEVASPLLLADLEGLSQPQLYSVCGGDASGAPAAADGGAELPSFEGPARVHLAPSHLIPA